MTVRAIIGLLRLDLPRLVAYWLITCAIAVVGIAVTGIRPWDEALGIGLGLLAIGIPLVPLFWLSPGWRGYALITEPGGRKAVGLLFGWAVVLFIPAVILMLVALRATGLQ